MPRNLTALTIASEKVNQTASRTVRRPSDPRSIEEAVRRHLADKVSGTMVGLWLLAPKHLRLGTWDLLCGWTGASPGARLPRRRRNFVRDR